MDVRRSGNLYARNGNSIGNREIKMVAIAAQIAGALAILELRCLLWC